MTLAQEFGVRERTEFEVHTSVDSCAYVIQPDGELDLATRDELHAALMAGLQNSTKPIVLDLSRTDFIHSTGIHLIELMIRIAAEQRRQFSLSPGPPQVQRMFELTGIAERLVFAD
jgi:anti-sigma B factor antagonist